MTTVNIHSSFHYSQPSEYHFSHDSVFLARLAFEYVVKYQTIVTRVMDLCAGCGIVGMDFLFHLHSNKITLPESLDYLEIQSLYKTHFLSNLNQLESLADCLFPAKFLNINYEKVFDYPELFEKYNLILSNPPFFRVGHGTLSPSEFKNRCRFFIDSDFKSLIHSLNYLLAPGGTALVLIKSLKRHGVDIISDMQSCANGLVFQKIDIVRGTDLFEITKPSP